MTATARWIANQRYDVKMGRHTVITDQPKTDGGDDLGPSPAVMLLGALAGCGVSSAGAYLENKGLPQEGLEVSVEAFHAQRPYRLGSFKVKVSLPPGIDAKYHKIIERVVKTCTVQKTLTHNAEIAITVVTKGN